MLSVSATSLRRNLFDCLKKAVRGEIVFVRWKGREVIRLAPVHRGDWRDRLKGKPRLRMPADSAFAPLDDAWDKYE